MNMKNQSIHLQKLGEIKQQIEPKGTEKEKIIK